MIWAANTNASDTNDIPTLMFITIYFTHPGYRLIKYTPEPQGFCIPLIVLIPPGGTSGIDKYFLIHKWISSYKYMYM